MRIESFTITNCRVLKHVGLPGLPPFCVFVGPNAPHSFGVFVDGVRAVVRRAT